MPTPYIYIQASDIYQNDLHNFPLVNKVLFAKKPHCGDLAFCRRQSLDDCSAENDTMLKLLDAAYAVERLIPVEYQYIRSHSKYESKDQLMDLVNDIEHDMLSNDLAMLILNLKIFKSSISTMYLRAETFYLVTILKQVFFWIFLILSGNYGYKNFSLSTWMRYTIVIIYGSGMVLEYSFLDEVMNPKIITHHMVLLMFILMQNNSLYIQLLCTYLTGSVFLFWYMLYWKYNNFKKAFDNYAKVLKIIQKEKQKLTILL